MRFRQSRRRKSRRPVARRNAAVGPELLEDRRVFSADPAAVDASLITWRGEEFLARRDSFVMRMPQTNAATSRGLWDYAAATPAIRAGWSIRPLDLGYFEIDTPGSSPADVLAWSMQVGAVAIAPNGVMEKQAIEQKLPNDPRFVALQQWGLNNTGQPPSGETADASSPYKADADIDAPEAWRIDPVNQNTGTRNIVVAIMDDGIDYTHPDLQANMWQRPANVPEKIAGDAAWYCGRFGFDVANRDEDQAARNIYSTMPGNPNDVHGTAVAGIIGAKGNDNRGMTGVNWDVSMLSANIFRDGGRYSSNADFLEAANRIIRLRTQYGVNIAVVNASWMSISLADAPWVPGGIMPLAVELLNQAGILFVTAAGNGYDAFGDFVGDLNDGDPNCPRVWPGNYYNFDPIKYGNVIAVGASTAADTLARFSNFGENVHIAAPGENIWTTVPLKAVNLPGTDYQSRESIQSDPRLLFRKLDQWSQTPTGITGGYAQLSGTSLSAAYVSGVAALAAAEYIRWTGVLPGTTYLRRAVVDQADAVSTLTYTSTLEARPNIVGRSVVDPNVFGLLEHPLHTISGNRRLNAYSSVKWVRENLPPKVSFANASVIEGDAGTTDVVLTAVLTQAVTVPLAIQYWTDTYANEATSGVDFVGIPASAPRSLTIPAGTKSLSVTLPGIVNGDTTFEPNERFTVRFSLSANAEAWLASKAIAVTIVNDDSSPAAPAVTLDPTEMVVTEGNGGTARPTVVNVPVTLDVAPTRTILVPYEVTSVANAGAKLPAGRTAATPGADYVALAGTLTFAAGQTSAVIPVRIVGDGVPAGATGESAFESFAVRLLQPNPGVLKQGRSVKIITIADDDVPTPPTPTPTAPLSVLQPLDTSVVKGTMASIPMLLSGTVPAGYVVTIYYRTVTGGTSGGNAVAGADFQGVASGRLLIPAGQSVGSVNVQTFANRTATYPRQFFVEITGAVYSKVGSTNPADSIRIDLGGLRRVMVMITD